MKRTKTIERILAQNWRERVKEREVSESRLPKNEHLIITAVGNPPPAEKVY